MNSGAMNAGALLDRAAKIIERRRAEYGDPVELFENVARRWSMMLGTEITPSHAILCLLDLKLSRLARDPGHADSLLDLIGYAVVLHEVTCSAATAPAEIAEVAEVAEAEGDRDFQSAEGLLNRAEVDRSIK